MKLAVKMMLAMGVLTLFILGSNVFSILQLAKINNASTLLAEEWMPSIVAIEEMNTLFSDFRIAEIQHVIATDPNEAASYEKQLKENDVAFGKRMQAYEKYPHSAEEQQLFDTFKRKNAEYMRLHAQIVALARQNKTTEAMKILNGSSRSLYLEATNILLNIVEINLQGGKKASRDGDALYESTSFSLLFLLGFSVVLAIGTSWLIIRSTLGQLGKDPGHLMHIARRVTTGDFNIDDGTPKIGVYGSLVEMVGSLKENIARAQAESQRAVAETERAHAAMQKAEDAGKEAQTKAKAMLVAADRLEDVAQVVSSASAELSAQIEQSEHGAAEQAARVTETATAMEEMNSTVLEVARNAGAASDVSSSTRRRAEAGAEVVLKAVKSIQQVREQSIRLKSDMTRLDESAKAISQIMGVISDIADQTNLLALNAAIEAARAGEAGRGFAVVADEVRKLAEKTMASTTDVGNAIRAIQQSATQSMEQVDASTKAIEEATEFASQSGVALNEIVSMVDNTADQVRAIATASEQQSASSEEINQSIAQVNVIAGETSRSMSEAARAVSDLAQQAQVLTRLIDDMKRG